MSPSGRKSLGVLLIITGFALMLYVTIGPPATVYSPQSSLMVITLLPIGFALAVGGALMIWWPFR